MGDHRRGFRAAYEASGASVVDRRIQVFSGKARSSAPHSSYFATTTTTPRPPPLADLFTDQRPPPRRAQRARSPSRSDYYHSSIGGGANSSAWCFGDPEMKRRKRVAKYKVYAVEGKVKASLRKGLRWIKCKCNEIVHGW